MLEWGYKAYFSTHTSNSRLVNLSAPNIIMAGDFTLVHDPSRDYYNYKHVNNPRDRQTVKDSIQDMELCDIWRELNPD